MIVEAVRAVRYEGIVYQPGEPFEMDNKRAKPAMTAKLVKPVKEAKSAKK